jgi:hypothetical protein
LPTPVQDTTASHGQAAPKTRKTKKARIKDQPVALENLKWLTIAQAALRYPAFTEKALRHLQSSAESYARYPKAGLRSNGFLDCVIRPAGQRKIIIDASRFETWLAASAVSGQSTPAIPLDRGVDR